MKVSSLIRSVVVLVIVLAFSVFAYNRVDADLRDDIKAENRELEKTNRLLYRERAVRKFTLSAFINKENSDAILKLTSKAYKEQYQEDQIAVILGIERKEDSNAVSSE